jgi:hypothetical protein
MNKTINEFQEIYKEQNQTDRFFKIGKKKKLFGFIYSDVLVWFGIGLIIMGSLIFLLSFSPALILYSGMLQEIAFVMFEMGVNVLTDYMNGNIDDVDSYMKNSLKQILKDCSVRVLRSLPFVRLVTDTISVVTKTTHIFEK